jgi:type IV secretory pathway VirB10-like protein
MSAAEMPPTPEREVAQALRLRAPATPVVRLSRRVLVGLGGAASVALAAAVLFALHTHLPKPAAQELYNTSHSNPAEGLGKLPKDYTGLTRGAAASTASASTGAGPKAGAAGGVLQLGPPLPGDLGRPILNAQSQGEVSAIGGDQTTATTSTQPTAVDPGRQKLVQERASAITSSLFTGGGGDAAAAGSQPLVLSAEASSTRSVAETGGASGATGASATSTGQDHKVAFLNGVGETKVLTDNKVESAERLQTPSSPYVVQAGTLIPAALVTGIRSDLPGEITAQVTQDVADSPSGRFRLIPQGSRLVGQYDSQVAFGQSRVLLVWTRLILPNGRSIVLDRLPGADAAGAGGLQDGVDNHWGQLFKAAALSSILGIGTQIGSGNDENGLIKALRQGPANTLNQAGQQVIGRSLNIAPTLTIRPGFQVEVLVHKDMVFSCGNTRSRVTMTRTGKPGRMVSVGWMLSCRCTICCPV